MFGMGPWELIIIFAIILLLFGGKKLPSIAIGLGTAIKNFKGAIKEEDEKKTIENKSFKVDKITNNLNGSTKTNI